MSDKATGKGLRDQLGDGYLNLLDSVRHSFEQAAWGQETTGDLSADFYRWAGEEPSAENPGTGRGVVEVEVSVDQADEFVAWTASEPSEAKIEEEEPNRDLESDMGLEM